MGIKRKTSKLLDDRFLQPTRFLDSDEIRSFPCKEDLVFG
jgi:hypothetical protein